MTERVLDLAGPKGYEHNWIYVGGPGLPLHNPYRGGGGKSRRQVVESPKLSRTKAGIPKRAGGHEIEPHAAVRMKASELRGHQARGSRVAEAELRRREVSRLARGAAHGRPSRAKTVTLENATPAEARAKVAELDTKIGNVKDVRARSREAFAASRDAKTPAEHAAAAKLHRSVAAESRAAGVPGAADIHDNAAARHEAAKPKRKPSSTYLEYQAAKQEQDRRFEDSRDGYRSKGKGKSAEELAYFGEGEHMGNGVEKRVTYRSFLDGKAAGNAHEKQQAATYKHARDLGIKHAQQSDTSKHDAEYNTASEGHDEETFGGGYTDGLIAGEAAKGRRAAVKGGERQVPTNTPTKSLETMTDRELKGATGAAANAERERRAAAKASGSPRRGITDYGTRYGNPDAQAQSTARLQSAAEATVDAHKASRKAAKGDVRHADAADMHTRAAAAQDRVGNDEQAQHHREQAGRHAAQAMQAEHDRTSAFTTDHQAELKQRLAAIPPGTPVTARQPGIERPTHGVVAEHKPDGSVVVAHRDRHDNTVRGTFNAHHVAPRAGEATPEHSGRTETAQVERASAANEKLRVMTAIDHGQPLAQYTEPTLRSVAEGNGKYAAHARSELEARDRAKAARPQRAGATVLTRDNPTAVIHADGRVTTPQASQASVAAMSDADLQRAIDSPTASDIAKGYARRELSKRAAAKGRPGPKGDAGEAPAAGIRVEHSGDGTVVYGTERGDTAATSALKEQGFKWSRSLEGWYLPRSWGEATRDQRVKALQSKLGDRVAVQRGDLAKSGTGAEQQAARVAAAERNAETNTQRAARLRAEADAQFQRSHDATAGIPFGQPILVGHHSQRRHENAIAKSHTAMRRGVDASAEAQARDERARSAAARARMETDPRAAARRLDRNEAEHRKIVRNLQGATGEHRDRLDAMRRDLEAKNEVDRATVAAASNGLGKHNVKPGDLVVIKGQAHVVTSTGSKNVKVLTSVGHLPYPYHQVQGHKAFGDLAGESTSRLEALIESSGAPETYKAQARAIISKRKG